MCLLLIAGLCSMAYADDLRLSKGVVYKEYKIARTEPDGIVITHSTGIAKILFWELPEDIQNKYNYDLQAAQAYHTKIEAEEHAVSKRLREAEYESRKNMESDAVWKEALDSVRRSAMKLVGDVLQINDDGVLIINAKTLYTYEDIDYDPSAMRTQQRHVVRRTGVGNVTRWDEPVFVIRGGKGYHDGARWMGTVYPAGTYQYVTVRDVWKTVKCFALTPEEVLGKAIMEEKSNRGE